MRGDIIAEIRSRCLDGMAMLDIGKCNDIVAVGATAIIIVVPAVGSDVHVGDSLVEVRICGTRGGG